jgi:hypothetical protein
MIARALQGKLLVFAIFFIGIATGVLSANFYRSRVAADSDSKPSENRQQERLSPQERARRDQDRFATYLGLDASQREQVQTILEQTRSQFKELREKVDPQFKAIEEESRTKIRAVLTEEQRKKYDEFREAHQGSRGRGPRSDRNSDRNKDQTDKP